jgi:small subunit ribosomal protein S20
VANIKSQIKRIKTNLKAQERNRAVKSELKTVVRFARDAIASGDKAVAVNAVATATRKLDKAVSKGVIHKNQAANRKSALASTVAALSGDTKVVKAPAKAAAKKAPKAAAKPAAKKPAAKPAAKKAAASK